MTNPYEAMQQRMRDTLAVYRVMAASGTTAKNRITVYRCATHRCLLLDVFNTPAGPAIYFPLARRSPERNATTAPAARETRTTDGDRRWVEHADLLDFYHQGEDYEFKVSCDHVLEHVLPADDVRQAMARRTPEILVPSGAVR